MIKNLHLLMATFLLIVFSSFSLVAQKANITGKVIDASTGEPLIGANVGIENTGIGAASDLNGEFTMYNVPVDNYIIICKYLGYESIELPVEMEAEMPFIEIEMKPKSILQEEVVISVQAAGQMDAINKERSSNTIKNIVASDRIREVPDANAAESIGRLPGVALQRSAGEGDKVVIRGLSPKHSVIEMDGVRMEGTGLDRSVGLSSVSTESLDGIELSKSLTADMDADAIGGVVNMRTRTADEGFYFNINTKGGYNSFNKSLNNYSVNGSVGNRFFDNKIGVLLSGGIERVNRSSDELSSSYDREITNEANWLYLKDSDIKDISRDRRRVNGGLVLDYKNDFLKIKFNNVYNVKHDDNERREAKYVFHVNRFEMNNSRGESDDAFQLHAINTEWKLWNTTLNADYSYTKSRFDGYNDNYYFDDKDSYTGSNKYSLNDLREQHPDNLIAESNKLVRIENSAVRWNHRTNTIREDVSQTINLNWKIPFRIGNMITGKVKTGYRYKKKNRESDRQTKELYFHGGIGAGRRQIVEGQIYPEYDKLLDAGISATGLAGTNFEDPDYDYGNFLEGRYQFPYAVDLDKLTETFDNIYNWVDNNPDIKLQSWQQQLGVPSNDQDYNTVEKLNAGYFMAEINIGKRILILPGLRYENLQTEYTSRVLMTDMFDPTGINTPEYPDTVTSYRENGHFFPSVNMKVEVTDWMDVRAAYYKSASRPNFIDLSPFMVTDDGLERLRVKNPYLKPALAHNVDIGISFFTSKLGLFSINGFYKKINGLPTNLHHYKLKNLEEMKRNGEVPETVVESLSEPVSLYDSTLVNPKSTSIYNLPINNPNPAEYAGFELSWQTNLWYLPGLWSGLVLDFNYSMFWSRTKYPYIEYITVIDSSGFFPVETAEAKYAETGYEKMTGQPNVLFNAKVGWDYEDFSSRFSFRYQPSAMSSIDTNYGLKDTYITSMYRVDVNLKYNITPRLSVSFDGVNLTNHFDNKRINNYVGDRDYDEKMEMYGTEFKLGVRYEF